MRSRPLAAILLALTLSACQLVWSYDDFKDQPSTGGSTSTASSSSSSSSGDSRLSTSSSSVWLTSSSSSSTSSSASSSSGCTLDLDKDHFPSWKCDVADATLDCADEDARAFPGADFEATPIMGPMRPGTQPWDFDCDGMVTQETPVATCGGYFVCPGSGFQNTGDPPACGVAYPVGYCAPNGFLGACVWVANNPSVMRVQRCK